MKNLKNQKGITLVALVVTIIVLLILAGVSLSLVAGSNGIMNKASNAVNKSKIASAQERAELEIMTALATYYEKYYVESDSTANLADVMVDQLSSKSVGKNATLTATKNTDTSSNAVVKFTLTVSVGSDTQTFECTMNNLRELGSWSEV